MKPFIGDEALASTLRNIAEIGTPPGAVAAAGVVGAFAAAVAGTGGLCEPIESANTILKLADADTIAYWSGDASAVWSRPTSVAEAVEELANQVLRTSAGNQADLDAARCLAFGASSAARVVARHNLRAAAIPRTRRTTLLAAAPSDAMPLLEVSRAAGPYLWDSNGAEWFDATAGLWNVPLGHGASQPVAGWLSQVVQVAAVDPFIATTEVSEVLGERLADLAGMPLASVFLNSSGSDANEVALRFALAASARVHGSAATTKVWALPGSFHGTTAGVAVLSSFNDVVGPLPDAARWPHIAPAEAWTTPGIAFVEPVSASRDAEGLPRADAIAIESFRSRGGVVIADEIASGLGRAAWPIASRAVGLNPDIVTLGKGLTNGVAPLSATIISREIAALALSRGLDFGHTYSNHAASAAAALATLDSLSGVDLDNQASRLRSALGEAGVSVSGRGLMLVVRGDRFIDRDKLRRGLAQARLVVHLLSAVEETDHIVLCPPLILTEEERSDLAQRTRLVCDSIGW